MSQTHWKSMYNPNYFGCYCFADNKDIILTIDKMVREIVVGENGKKEECTVMYFKEAGVKPLICNKTNCKTIQKIFKTPYIEEWRGRQVQLYADHNVRFGKETVEGVRVRPFLPKTVGAETKCTDCGCVIEGAGSMDPQQMADYTGKKYGRPLCASCATKANEAKKGADVL